MASARLCAGPARLRRAVLLASVLLLASAGGATARPLEHVSTSRAACPHGTGSTWHVAYETFGSSTFHGLHGQAYQQASPRGGRPGAKLRSSLRRSADLFGRLSHCAVGLRFDIYWARHHNLVVRQTDYFDVRARLLPLPTPVGGGPQRESQFFPRYDSVMEQFSATRSDGQSRLGYDYEGETYGYVSLLDAGIPDSSVVDYELLQGMARFFTTRGARIAPNPGSGMDAYCSALRRLHYHDIVRSTSETCTSDAYARDVIAGTVPVYHGFTRHDWLNFSVSRSWRRHHTRPAGLPAGHGRISTGAGPH